MDFGCLSEYEVRRRYESAKNKNRELSILADLVDSTKYELAGFLGVEYKKRTSPAEFVSEKAQELYDQDFSDEKIANALGVSSGVVSKWRKKNGLKSHAIQIDHELRYKLYNEGLSDGEIGKIAGVSTVAICTWRKSQNLPPNRQRGGRSHGKQ